MSEEITADERAKRVVDAEGNAVGIVDDVEDGTAYVDPEPGVPGEIKSRLGWGADERSTYPLRNDAVNQITDDEIRLRTRPEE